MAFTNPPIKSIPGSAALGGLALKQVESLAKANQVMPSPDIMVSRTTGGTFLKLRAGAGGGSGGGGGTGGGGGGGSTAAGERVIYAEIVNDKIRTDPGSARSYVMVEAIENGKQIAGFLKVYLPETLSESYKPTSSTNVLIMPLYVLGQHLYITKEDNTLDYIDLNVDARRWSIGITVCQNAIDEFYYIPAMTY